MQFDRMGANSDQGIHTVLGHAVRLNARLPMHTSITRRYASCSTQRAPFGALSLPWFSPASPQGARVSSVMKLSSGTTS